MSIPLARALEQVELEPGKTYSCQVRGLWVEVRVLDFEAGTSAIPESDIMLEPWVELPEPPAVSYGISTLGPPQLPDPPDIPSDEE